MIGAPDYTLSKLAIRKPLLDKMVVRCHCRLVTMIKQVPVWQAVWWWVRTRTPREFDFTFFV